MPLAVINFLQLEKQRRRRQDLERATIKEKEMEELRRRQEEKVHVAMRRNKEMEEKVLRQNKEREEKVLRENNEKAEKVVKENKERLATLLDENKGELAALVEKQEKEDRAARKRKADGPVAPECPVRENLIFAIFMSPVDFHLCNLSASGVLD